METQGKEKPIRPFASLKEVCKAHSRLKQRRYQNGVGSRFLRDVERFVQRGCLTGTILHDEGDRWYVQSMLDYWANVLYTANWPEPEATLAQWQPRALQLAA